METLLFLLIGIAIGALVVFLTMNNKINKTGKDYEANISKQQAQFQAEKAALQQKITVAQTLLESERKAATEKLNAERDHAESLRQEQQRQYDASAKAVRQEVLNIATKMLSESKQQLTSENKEKIDALLSPLKDQIESFNKNITASTKEGTANKTEIKTVFEDAIKKIHDEQEQTVKNMREMQDMAVRELKEQTEKIGNDAQALTKALKGDSKTQGDWGEMILEKTLDDCGLEKNKQYFLQQNFKGNDGNNYRPDAIVEFPNGERAVIDSKVSLTAYHEALQAQDESEGEKLMKEHVKSVKKHIDELSAVNYDKIVPGCIGYVLMFIPYESGYAAALKAEPGILQYAYRKHIIVLSPSNLLMALQLTHTMWQNYRMNKNVEEILRQSNELYDKFCTFANVYASIGTDIERLHNDYEKSRGQLNSGKGNIIRRLDNLKTLGINPKKEIPDSLQG